MYLWFLYSCYLKEEHKAKKGIELDDTKWTRGSLRATVSQIIGLCNAHTIPPYIFFVCD